MQLNKETAFDGLCYHLTLVKFLCNPQMGFSHLTKGGCPAAHLQFNFTTAAAAAAARHLQWVMQRKFCNRTRATEMATTKTAKQNKSKKKTKQKIATVEFVRLLYTCYSSDLPFKLFVECVYAERILYCILVGDGLLISPVIYFLNNFGVYYPFFTNFTETI